MNKCFNVIDTPWLPVREMDGNTAMVGLKEALTGAHRYVDLTEPSPPNLMALYRLLLALLNRALVREGVAWEPETWWTEGLPEKPIVEYLEKWRERFFVFHPEYPFMQVAALKSAKETKDKIKPWTQLALDKASGNTPLVFDHSQDDRPSPSATGSVLRSLIGFLQCTPGGLVKCIRDSDKAGPLADTAATLPLGDTLCRTLLLGLSQRPMGTDLPAWERPAPSIADIRSGPAPFSGLNDRYTRLTRAVLLLSENEDGLAVRHIRFAAGLAIEDNTAVPEPMAAYFMGKKGPIRLSLREGRALWRDLPSLIPAPKAEQNLHPRILDNAASILEAIDDDCAHIPVLVAGLASDQAKLERWRITTISLPKSVLNAVGPAAVLRDLVSEAEATGGALRKIAWELAMNAFPRAAKNNGLSNALPMQPVFFSQMEQAVPRLIRLLGEELQTDAQAHWRNAQADAARQAWKATCTALGASIPAIKAIAQIKWKHDALVSRLLKAAQGENSKEETA